MTAKAKPGRLDEMSGAGLLVTCTLCACLIFGFLTVCGLAIAGQVHSPGQPVEIPAILDRLVTGLVASVGTLLAKTYVEQKRNALGTDSSTVTAPPGSTVSVTPAADPAGGATDPAPPVDDEPVVLEPAPEEPALPYEVGGGSAETEPPPADSLETEVVDDPPAILALAGADGMAVKVPPKKTPRRGRR